MKKIVFVLSLLALTGSVVTSCSKDREEVATQKEDNAVTKENLAASGRFVVVRLTLLEENGKVLKKVTPGSGQELGYYGAFIFKKDETFTSFYKKSSKDIIKEESGKYELERNKLTLKGGEHHKDEVYEILDFEKGKSLKLKTSDVRYSLGKEQKITQIFEFEVKS